MYRQLIATLLDVDLEDQRRVGQNLGRDCSFRRRRVGRVRRGRAVVVHIVIVLHEVVVIIAIAVVSVIIVVVVHVVHIVVVARHIRR